MNETEWIEVAEPISTYSSDLIYSNECYKIIGLAMEIHNQLGRGFLENVYKKAFEIEFGIHNIDYSREKKFEVVYKDYKIADYYADFLVYDKIIIEVKASSDLVESHVKQTLNYLAASECKLGIIINFGEEKLKYKRVVLY